MFWFCQNAPPASMSKPTQPSPKGQQEAAAEKKERGRKKRS
jgi:hypothetical protein